MMGPTEEQTRAVLFVCTANICRSPMAAALFANLLVEQGLDQGDWRIESAGTWAPTGRPAAPEVNAILSARGLDTHLHRSREVSEGLLADFPLIIAMEPGQKEAMLVEFSALKGRVYTLAEMAGENGSVEDPTGGPLEGYTQTASEIERLLHRAFENIIVKAKI